MDGEGGRPKPAPSLEALPFFEVGRLAGSWYLSYGKTTVPGETIGDIIGRLTDWMSAIYLPVIRSELASARRKGDAEGQTPGAQAQEVLSAMQDASADMQDATENEPEDGLVIPTLPTTIDHFLEHPEGIQTLRGIVKRFKDTDPTKGTVNAYRGDRSEEFYEGVLTGFAAALKSRGMLESRLRGGMDITPLKLLHDILEQFAAGALELCPKCKEDGNGKPE